MSATEPLPLRGGASASVLCWLAGALLAATPVFAAAPAITGADVERARRQHRMPSEAELARLPIPTGPRIDALPQPATQPPIDLEALAKGFDVQTGVAGLGAATGPALLVFISFAMPEATVTRLLDQAARARATLVLRGLVNGSIRDTVTRMQQLIGNRQVAVQIDPQAFDRFAVVRTPAFVLVQNGAQARPCGAGTCMPGDQYLLAAGDVSLDYALRFFARSAATASPALARDATAFLQRMRGTH